MVDFIIALKAKIPFIGVTTDDPVNVKDVLTHWAGKLVNPLPVPKMTALGEGHLYFTEDPKLVTSEVYKKLQDAGTSCVVINSDKMMLVMDVGNLPTPDEFYAKFLQKVVEPSRVASIVASLRGLSTKTAQEVTQITMALHGAITSELVRKTRQMMMGSHPGLSTLDTEFDFYEWPKELKEWLALNGSYFIDTSTPHVLIPRGLLLDGPPGTGKTMAARAIARQWDVPLLRLNIPGALNRFIGVSEQHVDTNLTLIEQSAPCVWLLDEVDKLFMDHNEGTTKRILSQLLWWLQEHKSRVLTVLTTNKLEDLPQELYREGRIDRTIKLEKLSLNAAKLFATKVYEVSTKYSLSHTRRKRLHDELNKADKGSMSPAEVRVLVYDVIKKNNWLAEE